MLVHFVLKLLMNHVFCNNYRRFSAEEDKLIFDGIKKDKLTLTDLGKILSRHPHSILKRYDVLNNGRVLLQLLNCWKSLLRFFKGNIVVDGVWTFPKSY